MESGSSEALVSKDGKTGEVKSLCCNSGSTRAVSAAEISAEPKGTGIGAFKWKEKERRLWNISALEGQRNC